MNVFKAVLDTRQQNAVIGTITQFDNATLELQVLTDGVIDEDWGNPRFELIAMKRDMNSVREVDQDKFTILSKEEHKVQIELKEQFLTCRGTVKMQLVVKDGSRLSTTLFRLIIGQSLDHDIVESHRDVKVLDDLEAYVKQGFDDLAYQEQRMAAVEQSTNDLNDTMNANEAERNAAETKRSQIFETNETNRARTFNNQIEEQGVAFSNAQTQREKDFSESQQNMSQAFETSQRERESAFNKAQELNQTTFTNNETKRQTAFNQSQTANQQDFVDNEAERQRLFETNESSRQKSESQRVKNESERVFAETQRADAEVIRQQKITEFEEKATQLSEDLDSQVARVDEFVAANEEKLLGPHDKTDYMGNAHKSVKDANDANVEYILGEVNTVHYEGQHITATDTIEKQVRSAILKGQTLVNLATITEGTFATGSSASRFLKFPLKYQLTNGKKYIVKLKTKDSTLPNGFSVRFMSSITNERTGTFNLNIPYLVTKDSMDCLELFTVNSTDGANGYTATVYEIMVIEYQDGIENWDIPYFEGMQSVKLPVLITKGKNLFDIVHTQTTDLYGRYFVGDGTYTLSLIDNDTTIDLNGIAFGNSLPNNVNWLINNGAAYGTTRTFTDSHIVYYPNSEETINKLKQRYHIQIEHGAVATSYEPHKSNILTVNEEVELRGIGDGLNRVEDELNCLTGEVTERIGEIVLDGSESWSYNTNNNTAISNIQIVKIDNSVDDMKIDLVCDKLPSVKNGEGIRYYSKSGKLYIEKKFESKDLFLDWLNTERPTIQFPKENAIKTVDLSGQKVYSYDGTTHYSCSAAEGALIPTLSIDVPTNLSALVSRQRTTIENQKEQIITLEEENEQLIAQNEVQDIDISLNQDAINFMLFAQATMSVNNEGVNTMAAYLANQILKGKLDYTLVVSRYGSYKEDIDTILITEGKQDLIK